MRAFAAKPVWFVRKKSEPWNNTNPCFSPKTAATLKSYKQADLVKK